MKVLLIPYDDSDLKSNLPLSNRIRLISGKNQIIGNLRVGPFSLGMVGLTSYIKFLRYAIDTFFFGLKHRKEFDLIYSFELHYSLIGLSIALFTGKPCVRDCATVNQEWIERVKPPKLQKWIILMAVKIIKRFIKMNIVLSDADRRSYIKYGFPPERLVTIPRPADLTLADEIVTNKETLREKLGLDQGKRIVLFTGRREYPPNMEAAEWIMQELAPAIARKLDNVQILMTGNGRKPAATHSMVTFTGLVPNLFEYLYASDIFIAPIEMPSGRLTKAFDSLSCGMPTVVLASATNGIPELVDGDNAIIAKDRNEFIEKTIYFLEHPAETREIGLRGRKMLEEHYSWKVWEERVNQVLNGVVGR